MSDKEVTKGVSVTPTVDMSSLMDVISKHEDKTKVTVLRDIFKDVDDRTLEFITEYPTVKYTKELTKLNTWRASVKQVFELSPENEDIIVKEMCNQFMLKMTSHRGNRVKAIINALRNEDSGTRVYDDNRGMRKFLGQR